METTRDPEVARGIFEESRIRKSGRPSSKVSKEITIPRRNTLNQRSFETWTAITDTNYFSLSYFQGTRCV